MHMGPLSARMYLAHVSVFSVCQSLVLSTLRRSASVVFPTTLGERHFPFFVFVCFF